MLKAGILFLPLLLICGTAGAIQSAWAEDTAFMDKLVWDAIVGADLSAHVQVLNIWALKRNGPKTLYYIDAKVLRGYFGKIGGRLMYHQWAETDLLKSEPAGERIVSLRRDQKNRQYYAVENGSVIKATPRLLKVAASAVIGKLGKGTIISARDCESGSYPQPGGNFGLQIYCDDGLATNANVQLIRMSSPILGAYSLQRRSWQGGDWSGDITSYLWSKDKNQLFIATSAFNGTGSVYRLDLPRQKSSVIWKRGKKDCVPLLQREDKAQLLIKVGDCDGQSHRQVRVTLK